MKYRTLFFDLDHTLWDFDTNSRNTLQELYSSLSLADWGVTDFDRFHQVYLRENERLWKKYRNGHIKVDELRWKRFWLALLEFQIGDESLARQLADSFLALLPTRTELFPGTLEVLDYLQQKKYALHLITNGF
ncbi:MAG: HAD family hydrolase, partial [Chitinophagaceae bacterium]